MSKHIGDVENDKFSLEVVECECGFHLGVDTSYLEQVGSVEIICPSCKKTIKIEEYE